MSNGGDYAPPSGVGAGRARMSKWEYLKEFEEKFEEKPKLSKSDILKSLEVTIPLNSHAPVPHAPNLAPANHGENFYDETHQWGSNRSRDRLSMARTLICTPMTKKVLLLAVAAVCLSVGIGSIIGATKSYIKYQASRVAAQVDTSDILYEFNEDIEVDLMVAHPKPTHWVGLWQNEKKPVGVYTISDVKPAMWMDYCPQEGKCNEKSTLIFSENTKWNTDYATGWPLCNGKWVACVVDSSNDKVLDCSKEFAIYDGSCDGVCKPATGEISSYKHKLPTPNSLVTKIAFGSCYEPENQVDSKLWDHMRQTFKADLWLWLGDNMYGDGEDMQVKRQAYNLAKHNVHYLNRGPLAVPEIPVMGTWDDHDAGKEMAGGEFQCHKLAQDEFAHFFDLAESDPRHPKQGSKQQKGVYSSMMFSRPDGTNGIHVILLDVRYFRSPTFAEKGYCRGANSTMLGDEQWKWLENELQKPSVIKIIGSGMQVMQPTDQKTTDVDSYCANDGKTFFDAIDSLEENNKAYVGTHFEGWNQIPQEKARLLQMLQQTINQGKAHKAVIISGDMHWAEMMAKRMPAPSKFGPSQVIYEVTASGIDKNWPYADPNSNRLRVRSADKGGDGVFVNECKFPFTYDDQVFNDCTEYNDDSPWCSLAVDSNGKHIEGHWGICAEEADELLPRHNLTVSTESSCMDSLHICKARSNYGGIEVDWEQRLLTLSIFTPHNEETLAARAIIGF